MTFQRFLGLISRSRSCLSPTLPSRRLPVDHLRLPSSTPSFVSRLLDSVRLFPDPAGGSLLRPHGVSFALVSTVSHGRAVTLFVPARSPLCRQSAASGFAATQRARLCLPLPGLSATRIVPAGSAFPACPATFPAFSPPGSSLQSEPPCEYRDSLSLPHSRAHLPGPPEPAPRLGSAQPETLFEASDFTLFILCFLPDLSDFNKRHYELFRWSRVLHLGPTVPHYKHQLFKRKKWRS